MLNVVRSTFLGKQGGSGVTASSLLVGCVPSPGHPPSHPGGPAEPPPLPSVLPALRPIKNLSSSFFVLLLVGPIKYC